MATSSNLIYGLIDPRTRLIRYIGLSNIGLKRARQHRAPARLKQHSHKNAWIRSLLAEGFDYEIVVLDDAPADLKVTERFWIAYGRASGWPLTNLTDGGDGANGWRHTADTRAKISTQNRGRKRTPEFKARMSAMKKGRLPAWLGTVESRAKAAAARRGRPGKKPSTEARAKMSASHLGRPATTGFAGRKHNAETLQRMSEAQKRSWQMRKLASIGEYDA